MTNSSKFSGYVVVVLDEELEDSLVVVMVRAGGHRASHDSVSYSAKSAIIWSAMLREVFGVVVAAGGAGGGGGGARIGTFGCSFGGVVSRGGYFEMYLLLRTAELAGGRLGGQRLMSNFMLTVWMKLFSLMMINPGQFKLYLGLNFGPESECLYFV